MNERSITRRQALFSLPALAVASRALAQGRTQFIRVRSMSHLTLTVSDRKRSVEFYQGLFGLPVQHRQGNSIGLRIGSGPQMRLELPLFASVAVADAAVIAPG